MGQRTWRDVIHFPRNHPPSLSRSRTEDKNTINDSDNKAIQPVTNSTGFSPLRTLFHMLRLRGSTRSKKLRAGKRHEMPPVPEEKESLFRGVPVLDGATLHPPPPPGAADLQRCRLGGTPVTAKSTGADLLRLREVEVLAEIRHPNILLLMGLMKTEPNTVTLVFEDAVGTIYQLLHEKSTAFSFAEVRVLMVQLCEVMIFLHEKGWLHTAISSHTILITKNNLLKLSGFEWAQNIYRKRDSRVEEEEAAGRFRWQSPEQLLGPGGTCKASDVFSSAMVFWEMCTGRVPWSGLSVDDLVQTYATEGAASLLRDRRISSPVRDLLHKSLTVQVQRRKMDFVKMMEAILAINEEHGGGGSGGGSGGAALKKVRVTSQPTPQTAKFNNLNLQRNREESSPKNLRCNWYSVKSSPQTKESAVSFPAHKCMCQKREFPNETVNYRTNVHRRTDVQKNSDEPNLHGIHHSSRNTELACESSTKQYQPTAIKPASHQNQRTLAAVTPLVNGDEEKSKTTSSTIESAETFHRSRPEMSYQCFDANGRTRVKQLALAIDTFVSKWELEGQPLKEKTSTTLVDPEARRQYGRIVRAIKRVADRYPHLFAFSVPRECPSTTIYQNKLFEQKVKNPTRAEQTNSKRRITELKAARSNACETEDLYIDDDFANGLDLDPHMQLLLSFEDLRPGKYRFLDYGPSVVNSYADFNLDSLLET